MRSVSHTAILRFAEITKRSQDKRMPIEFSTSEFKMRAIGK